MIETILITDSLFIFDEHVKKLKAAGYEVERLDKPKASEDELIQAIKGKVGYILGGIEKVTPKVLEAADKLRAIAFTGADWQALIPGWEIARKESIKISNTPGSNATAVAEYAMAIALAMQRNVFELGRGGQKTFETTASIQGAVVGIVGMGNIGQKLITLTKAFDPRQIVYWSKHKKEVEAGFLDLSKLVEASDIIFVAVAGSADNLLSEAMINLAKNNALIVSISPLNVTDMEALLKRLKAGTLRAATDWPAPSPAFDQLPKNVWYNSNDHTAYNTFPANQLASDWATDSIINLLQTGEDSRQVL